MPEEKKQYTDFKCPECGDRLRAKKEHSGTKGNCPKCGKMVTIPKNPR
jgi:predicted RNA-binding Zn-ribbon protein involved in translation (DUF1610 family)